MECPPEDLRRVLTLNTFKSRLKTFSLLLCLWLGFGVCLCLCVYVFMCVCVYVCMCLALSVVCVLLILIFVYTTLFRQNFCGFCAGSWLQTVSWLFMWSTLCCSVHEMSYINKVWLDLNGCSFVQNSRCIGCQMFAPVKSDLFDH